MDSLKLHQYEVFMDTPVAKYADFFWLRRFEVFSNQQTHINLKGLASTEPKICSSVLAHGQNCNLASMQGKSSDQGVTE